LKLEDFGFDGFFADNFAALADRALEVARVAVEHRGGYQVWAADGARAATASGRLTHAAADRLALPVVGDWVALASGSVITHVLPRRGCLVRQAAGERTEPQPIAANVDLVLLVTAPGDFHPRRLERYLAAAWDGGAAPVIVINKADTGDAGALLDELGPVAAGVPTLALSALSGDGVDAVLRLLQPARTVALLGSSGVGKTTLVGRLGGGARATAAVRAHDQRGRHTTTRRELIALPGGAVLVDTPGMRELAAWDAESGLGDTFADVGALAAACRFRDCGHDGEPDCAVAEAIAAGELAPERLASRRKLERELAFQARRTDAAAQAAQKRMLKARSRALRKHYGGGE